MRVDAWLHRCRFVRSRSRAHDLVDTGLVRRDGVRLHKASEQVVPGQTLTFPIGRDVRIVEILRCPERRGSPADAQACYRVLDRVAQTAIARAKAPQLKDTPAP
ncbi:S4 domain-containing protein [Qipengyuania sp. JC766]|uniref:S4 domain-containing protein n=1 Tax=Qipengyuania sp. JC766 TaxID=3232139 RepID=UPI003459E287